MDEGGLGRWVNTPRHENNKFFGALMVAISGTSQVVDWHITGNGSTSFGTHYVGTSDATRMTIGTYDKMRLVVNEESNYDIGSFSLMPTAGFVGISPSSYFWDNGPGPFSRLHLAEPGANGFQGIGYRPWMRNGVTFTGNSDQMYIGQKYTYDNPEEPESGELNDYTDAIVQWSDNPGTWLSDRMRFIFTSEYSSSNPTGSNSMEGLEAMQLYPHDSGSEVFVGIGDWFGQSATPDERLDVLDRTVMIRRLVPDYENQELDRFVVTDNDGRLHWRSLANLPDNCEWTMSGTSPNHVITAVGAANSACPDDAENVGIGDSSPEAKLDVLRNYTSSNDLGIQVSTFGNNSGTENIGVKCIVQTASGQTSGNEHYGVHARAYDGAVKNFGVYGRGWLNTGKTTTDNMGVHGDTQNGSGQATNAYGVKGYSSGLPTTQGFGVHGYVHTTPTDSSSAVLLAGVYGSMQHANYPNRWAAYFVGAGLHTAGVWQTSDAMLKQNVTDLLNASDILAQLQPKRYQFRTGDYPQLGLPEGSHDGIMAGDLQAVLPNLVRTVNHPAVLDTLGNVIYPAVSFKAVNSDGLIPILVGASNEHTTELNTLQDQVSQLQQQIATLQQDLATCCSAHGSADGRGMSTGAGAGAGAGEALRTDLFIVPNPVADHTQLRYTVATPGRTRLEVSDASGKRLEVLEEAVREAGAYTHDWTTTDLAPGTYHVTLYLNESFVVKKAVKVGR